MGKLRNITLGAVAAAPLDPSGAALALAIGSGTTWITRGAWRKLTGSSHRSDASDGPETAGSLTNADIASLRHIVRAITASTIGLTTSTGLATVLPYHLVPTGINAAFLIHYVRELRKLATKAGGKRALCRSISTHQLVADVALATVLKTIFLILFLGHDFDVIANSWAHSSELILGHMDTGVTPLVEKLPGSEVAQWHAAFSEHGVLPISQGVVDVLPAAVQEEMIGTSDPAVWGSEAAHRMGAEGILFVGTMIAGMDQWVRIAMEDPSERLVRRMQRS